MGWLTTLLSNAAFVLLMLCLFAASGWWAVAPFRRYLRYPVAVAAMAGMPLLACTVLLINVVAVWPFWLAAVAGVTLLVAGSVGTVLLQGHRSLLTELPFTLGVALGVALAVCVLLTRAELRTGEPSLVYLAGSDHMGYGQTADWLRLHRDKLLVELGQEGGEYESWPDLEFKLDPRFGTFSLVAVMSLISGRSGAFTYDIAAAVVLAVVALGLAGMYASKRIAFALLVAAILVSPLYEAALLGFLGKLVGLPLGLLVTGLYFQLVRADLDDGGHTHAMLAGLGAITVSTGMMFSGFVPVVTLACFGALFVALRLVPERRTPWRRLGERFAPVTVNLLLLAIASVLASGVVARPIYLITGGVPASWEDLWYQMTNVAGLLPKLAELPGPLMTPAALLVTVLACAIAAANVRRKQPEGAALALGTVLFCAAMFVMDDRWRVYQTAVLYPLAILCAAAHLSGNLSLRGRSVPAYGLGASLMVLCLAIGVYRGVDINQRIGGGTETTPQYIFVESELEGLIEAVRRGGPVTIDAGPTVQMNLVALAELGRNELELQFSEQSFAAALGYRRTWKFAGEKPYPLRLVLRSPENDGKPNVLYRTRQYDLLGPAATP